ncbi:hypothetical protein N8791_04485 [Gammaproteobacteria bacterium]|nr:hypothetical protein [Gammaproteobacteria bacterium]
MTDNQEQDELRDADSKADDLLELGKILVFMGVVGYFISILLDDFFLEYYPFIIPVLILIAVSIYFIEKEIFSEEEKFLRAGGFKRKRSVLRFDRTIVNIPSRGFVNNYVNPITSEHHPNLLIFIWHANRGGNAVSYTRVFRFKSLKRNKFPKFIIKPERTLDKLKDDIDYEESPEFSKNFFLTAQGDKDNENRVRELFQNRHLQDCLLAQGKPWIFKNKPKLISIESNGDEIFYYWDDIRMSVEEFPGVISEIEKLHNNFFDL